MNRPEKLKWISTSPALCQDERLGEDRERFLPARFSPDGRAIDGSGETTSDLACFNCHLPIPREALQYRPFFVSVAGTPSSGKTYFQTAMIHNLRQTLESRACLEFRKIQSGSSELLFENEQALFGAPEQDELVSIEKTQEFGELYRLVQFDQQLVSFPQPFLFLLKPTHRHPNRGSRDQVTRLMAFYDNAGESYEPGRDSLVNPVTRHLGLSNVIMFCLDLTQESAFQHPRFQHPRKTLPTEQGEKQLECLRETISRANEYSQHGETPRNLVVVVTKFDLWSDKLGIRLKKNLWLTKDRYSVSAFDTPCVEQVSERLREALRQRIPEFVKTAEAFSRRLLFVPVSSTGSSPETDADGFTGIRPSQIRPLWTEAPIVYSMAKWCGGLVPYAKQGRPWQKKSIHGQSSVGNRE